MIAYEYGLYDEAQFASYKKKLHDLLYWLLLYKDPKTRDEFVNVNYNKYFENLMKRIDGFNKLMNYPKEIVEMDNLLESAFIETQKDTFDYKAYRKLVLDAEALIDKIGVHYDNTRHV